MKIVRKIDVYRVIARSFKRFKILTTFGRVNVGGGFGKSFIMRNVAYLNERLPEKVVEVLNPFILQLGDCI